MTKNVEGPNAFIFMKVGKHAGEEFGEIMERKREEQRKAGAIWWGYGGPTLHPINKVQPFVKYALENHGVVRLLMQVMDSSHPNIEAYADEHSSDGKNWYSIPENIAVRGSRYAMILDEIVPDEQQLDLGQYRVPLGPSQGKVGAEYVSGRVDKACLEYVGKSNVEVSSKLVDVHYSARVKSPYAVLLRGGKND